MRFSRTLAALFGVLAPVGETIRRWGALWDDPPALLDDYVMGGLLLAGAWAARRGEGGRRLLAAAWGVTCGMGYYSVFGQLRGLRLGEVDPAPVPSEVVLAVKLIGTLLAVVALVITVRSQPAA